MLQNLRRLLVACVCIAPLLASAQGVDPVRPSNSSGASLFSSAFASADNIAAQTATFIHGGLMAWDSGGGNWDRVLLTSGALHVNVQNASLAVTGTFWQATQPVSAASLPLPSGAATEATLATLLLNSTYVGRMPAGASPADNESNTITALSRIGGYTFVFDGVAWDRWTGAVSQSGTWNINNVSGAISLPTGASTLAEQQTQTTALQLIDDTVHASDAALSKGIPVFCQFDDTTPGTTTENNVRPLRCSTRREAYFQIRDAAGNERGANVTAAGALSVDPGSVTISVFPDNEPFNLAQVGGNAVSAGNGISGTGVQRVTIASDSTGQVAIASLPNEGQQTAANSISVTPDTDNDSIGATGAAPPGEATFVGGLASGATGGFLTGLTVCDSFVNVNVSSATTTALVTGVSGRHVRICAINLVTAAANNVALISGTGATCGTGTTGMNGGTTAASGWNFAANTGLAQGSGLGEINRTNATGDSVCIVTSAATQLSGRISYTIY